MSSKFGYSARYENLAKDLIHNILGFRDGDENFIPSMDYVMSNLLYHHYLDVNDHQIQRSLQGISFKMIVHGHQKKADQLQALTDKFLALPALEDKGDLKWSILSLLNELSQHPAQESLSASFALEIQNSLEPSLKKDLSETDWINELMDRSFHLQDKDETLSEWSDDDDEMKKSLSLSIPSDHPQQQQNVAKGREVVMPSVTSSVIEEREKRNALVKEAHLASSWIKNKLQFAYWNADVEKVAIGSLKNGCERLQLSEYAVMRECLWLLLEPSSGYIFTLDAGEFNFRPVTILSLKQKDLQLILQSFSIAASNLLAIDKWLLDVESRSSTVCTGSLDLTGTFRLYSDGLRKWRIYFHAEVNRLEKQIFTQEGCQTLLWLLNALEPLFSNLKFISNILAKTFESPQESILCKSLKLLSLLIEGIESGMKKEDKMCILILLQFALKGYLKSIHTLLWGLEQPRPDLLQAFGIIRNTENPSSENAFCLQPIKQFNLSGLNFLRCLRRPLLDICNLREVVRNAPFEADCEADYLEKLLEKELLFKYFQKSENTPFENLNTISNVESNNNLIESRDDFRGDKIESWLTDSLESDLLNKNQNEKLKCNYNPENALMEYASGILERKILALESTSKALLESVLQSELQSISNTALESLTKSKVATTSKNSTSKDSSSMSNNIDQRESISTFEKLESIESEDIFCDDLFLMKAFDDENHSMNNETIINPFKNEDFQPSLGFDHMLTSTLLPVVQNRYKQMGKHLLRSLADESNLRQQIETFIAVILLDANAYMNEFYSYVFNKVNNKEDLEEGDLTQNLQFCIGLSNPELAPYFGITLRKEDESKYKSKSSAGFTENILSSLSVEFGDLWPLCLVVKENHLMKYNKIFNFCLMLRRASYTVERLHFKELTSFNSIYVDDNSLTLIHNKDNICPMTSTNKDDIDPMSSDPKQDLVTPLAHRIHRLQLLRQWVLYLSRILRDHFSSAIFVPFNAKLVELLNGKHFTDFKTEHEILLNNVCHDCLLNEETLAPIHITLTQLFSTVERIHDLWVGSVYDITDSQLSFLEEQYSSSHRILSIFLSTLADVRFCPLVEGLDQCLTYNCPV